MVRPMTDALATWVDGQAANSLPLPDRGLEFGDGLYETLAVREGGLRLLDRHLARLQEGCRRLAIDAPARATLVAELRRAAAVPGAGLVKLVLTRGAGGTGYVADAVTPRRIVQAFLPRIRAPEWATQGVAVRRCRLRLAEQPALAGLKHLNRLEQVLARREWADPAIAEGLTSDVHGYVVCGTMTNVFAVYADSIVTPELARCGVAGVVRAQALDWLAEAGHRVVVRDLRDAELDAAREIFLTNAVIGAWPVRALDGRTYEPGPVCRELQQRLARAWESAEAGVCAS